MPEGPDLERELGRAIRRHADAIAVSPDLARRITERALARRRRRRRLAWGGIPAALGAGGVALGLGLSLGTAVPLAQSAHRAQYGAASTAPGELRSGTGVASSGTNAGKPTATDASGANQPSASAAPSRTSGGLCPERSRAQLLARAQVAVIARALPGEAVTVGTQHVLASPVRFAVVRYEKGHGPSVLAVDTGVNRAAVSGGADKNDIRPLAGQTWEILSPTRATPLVTSLCDGSHVLTAASGP